MDGRRGKPGQRRGQTGGGQGSKRVWQGERRHQEAKRLGKRPRSRTRGRARPGRERITEAGEEPVVERSSPCFLRSCYFAFSVMVQFALVIPAARFCRATDLSPPREYRRSFAHKTHVWHASFIRATCTTSAFPATSAYNTNPLNLQAMSMPTQPHLPRKLCQQRSSPGECLGFFSGVWNPAAAQRDGGRDHEFSRSVCQPATGQGPACHFAAEHRAVRECLWGNQA